MATSKDATGHPNNDMEKMETQQDIIESINKLLRRKTELDFKSTAKSLNKNDVDLALIMSDEQVQRELRSLERTVAGYIGICEHKLRQRIEDLVAPESYAERNDVVLEPLPESMIVEEPLIEEVFGIGKHATTSKTATTAPRPLEADSEQQKLIQEKFRSIQDPINREGEALYFFYGTLMDPATLQRVTGLQATPRMRPAHVVGYTTKLWGPFPVLLHGRRDDLVRGMACEIEGSGPKRRLEEYEGKDYDEWELDLRLDKPDGTWEVVPGVTFKWVGPRDELQAGTFSLSKWQDI
ncbi:hypothetical protein INS49_010928 [Diaporthe citri]|uniref:uncharacterized protein n=1 Tax=Diaporthe citri TaxID=83186 RepID=UPI001C7F784B|nr:uncharacterized protein INS49_010928 [Diaporthe citri]KAG6359875.1 hypothetical protein INS49_010928 [Diaporthe citri]